MKKINRVGFLGLLAGLTISTTACSDLLSRDASFANLSLSEMSMSEGQEIGLGLETPQSLENYELFETIEGENGIPVVGSDNDTVENNEESEYGDEELVNEDAPMGGDEERDDEEALETPQYELVCKGNGRNCEYVNVDHPENADEEKEEAYENGEGDSQMEENPKYRNNPRKKFSGNGSGQFICILEGQGKSVRLGITNSSPAGQVGTPQVVCMTQQACTGIVSQKFQVKMAHKRGFCPNKNPHVFSMTDAEVQSMIDAH